MAEFIAPGVQTVGNREPVTTVTSVPCNCGRILHENFTGIYTLRGPGRFSVVGKSNIAVPTGGTVAPIAVAITVSGEIKRASRAVSTPAAVGDFNEVTAVATVTVPCGCCVNVAFEPVPASSDPTVTPVPAVDMQDTVVRIVRTN